MLRTTAYALAKGGRRRELRNPNSPLGKAYRTYLKQSANEARFSEMSGVGMGEETAEQIQKLTKPSRIGINQRQASLEELVSMGKSFAGEVKSMSDPEWEAVPLKKKRAFAAFIEQQLTEAPSEVSEQQRRRFFETTMKDPAKMDFSQVKDKYQRLKMGLPIAVEDPQQSLGVTKAMYENAEADLFDPTQAYKLENAMTHFKQLFVDYVQKKKSGTSTEMERRRLANLSAELNYQTQRHLANMFKFAEQRVQETIIDEKRQQLLHIEAIKEAVKAQRVAKAAAAEEGEGETADNAAAGVDGAIDGKKAKKKRLLAKKQSRAARIKATLRDVYGIDTGVATTVLREMKTQERFLQKCEVLARLTLKRGFSHSADDESLGSYTESLRGLYSMDASKLAGIDATQYMAAKDSLPPLDWAKRWYERALLVPLQATPEYQALDKLRRDAEEAKRAEADGQLAVIGSSSSSSGATRIDGSEDDGVPDVIDLVERMFLPPDDERLQKVHEKRLRYVAYLHMESQIKRMRANAKLFEGVEDLPEAEEAKALYERLLARKKAVREEFGDAEGGSDDDFGGINPYHDAEVSAIFEELMAIVENVIHDRTILSEADRHAERLRQVVATIKGGHADRAAAEAYETVLAKKEAVMGRILNLLEKDAREDMLWVENMMEAERPPLLPIPEPMSYVSAADVAVWKDAREAQTAAKGNPFKKGGGSKNAPSATFSAKLLGQEWNVPDKPLLFWGTGSKAIGQALQHAAEDAERRRSGKDLAPPYPCPENPWGWKLKRDILEE